MRRLFTVLFGVVLGGGLVYVAFEYHLVRTDENMFLVPKKHADLADPYVDIRDWSASQWKDHPVLAENLIADGHANLVGGSIAGGLMEEFVAPFMKEPKESSGNWWKPNPE